MCDFIEWLDTLSDDTRQVNVLAHNFQGYDENFIVHEYHGQNRILKQPRNRAKLLEVVHDNIRFIDSMSFFQMPLAAFPKTFGLTELKKGFFLTNSTCPNTRTMLGNCQPSTITYQKPSCPKTAKHLKRGTGNNGQERHV